MRQSYSLILRFMLIGLLLLVATHQLGAHLIKVIMPLYEWMFKLLEYRFDQVIIELVNQHGESVLQVNTILSQPFWVIDANGASQQIAPTEAMLNMTSLAVGYICQPLIIIGTIVLAWPVSIAKQSAEATLPVSHTQGKTLLTIFYRLLIATPLLVLIMLVDAPVQLLHASWGGMEAGLQLGAGVQITNIAWLGYWSDCLNGGGLMALSIAVGLLVVGVVEYAQAQSNSKLENSASAQ